MLYDLLEREIKSDLRRPPETKALEQEREFSLGGVHKWIIEVARSGYVHDRTHGEVALSKTHTTEVGRASVREAARAYCTSYEGHSVEVRLGILLKAVGVESDRRMQNGRSGRTYDAFQQEPISCPYPTGDVACQCFEILPVLLWQHFPGQVCANPPIISGGSSPNTRHQASANACVSNG
jgi:hypothetical protein